MESPLGVAFKHDGNYSHVFDQNGEQVGEMVTSKDLMGARNAKNFFGNVYDGGPVRRTNGIYLEDSFKGQGLGQKLYLFHMAHFPGTWFYNSQTWADATNTLKTLGNKGLVELYWHKEPQFGEEGGIHLSRLTPQGAQVAATLK